MWNTHENDNPNAQLLPRPPLESTGVYIDNKPSHFLTTKELVALRKVNTHPRPGNPYETPSH